MRQDEQRLNKRHLLLSIVILSISIVVTTTSVFAWFFSTQKSDIKSFNLTVKSQFVEGAAIESYALSTITKGETQNTYKPATANNQLVRLYNMPSFDEHSIVLNDYQPALAINITFTASASIVPAVTAKTKEGLVSVGTDNWMSNCVQFDFAAFDEENLILTTDKAPVAFVGITQEGLIKTNEIEIYRGFPNQGPISLWFVVEYNKDVLLRLHEINKDLEAEIITYFNDITFTIDAV